MIMPKISDCDVLRAGFGHRLKGKNCTFRVLSLDNIIVGS
jgi:hypothetical protein